jgi:galactonate dehydratase
MAEAFGMRVGPHNCASAPSTAVAIQVGAYMVSPLNQEIYKLFPERLGYVQVLEDPPQDCIVGGRVTPPGQTGPAAPWRRKDCGPSP